MHWIRKGIIFKPEGNYPWNKTHAQVPFPLMINDRLRIYFATRDAGSCSSVSFIEVNPGNPAEVLYVHNEPCLSKGRLGCFDDSGTMPSWFRKKGEEIYLYYTGWNKSQDISYRLAIGMAVSRDDGLTFQREYTGPILDRSPHDPVWVAQPSVLHEDSIWRMWYLSCQKIEMIHNHPEPFYNVKVAESANGIDWMPREKVCIDFDEFTSAIGRPFVYKENGVYKMLYSYRNASDYRTDPARSYRIGYSQSENGVDWERKDERLSFSGEKGTWEAVMNAYPCTYQYNNRRYLIYNGNGFGQTGFGYAVLSQ